MLDGRRHVNSEREEAFIFIFEAHVRSRLSAAPERGRRLSAVALFWLHVLIVCSQKIVNKYVLEYVLSIC